MFEEKILSLAEAKLDGNDPGRLTGYASVFGGVDSYGDTIVPGAYTATIPKFLKDGFIPWGHDWSGYPVATPDRAKEDDHGLWIEAVFHTDAESQRARQIVSERLERGKSMGLSIGYQAKSFDFTEMDGRQVRRLTEIDLMEVSLVSVPADDAARVSSVKAKRRLSRHQIEAVITTLQALLGDDEAEDVADAINGDDGKATPFEAIRAYAERLKTADDAALLAVRDHLPSVLADLGAIRGDLEAVAKRAAQIGADDPRELFRRLQGLAARGSHLDHIATGQRAAR